MPIHQTYDRAIKYCRTVWKLYLPFTLLLNTVFYIMGELWISSDIGNFFYSLIRTVFITAPVQIISCGVLYTKKRMDFSTLKSLYKNRIFKLFFFFLIIEALHLPLTYGTKSIAQNIAYLPLKVTLLIIIVAAYFFLLYVLQFCNITALKYNMKIHKNILYTLRVIMNNFWKTLWTVIKMELPVLLAAFLVILVFSLFQLKNPILVRGIYTILSGLFITPVYTSVYFLMFDKFEQLYRQTKNP